MARKEYFASQGSLKLKGVADHSHKKKKKKSSKRKDMKVNIKEGSKQVLVSPQKTEAERKFEERKRIKESERILKKANKTHKEKVEEFNRHLDGLTEHFDIPKVSWTK